MNRKYASFGTLLTVLAAGLIVSAAYAGDGQWQKGTTGCGLQGRARGCFDCGCRHTACHKVCRLKAVPKKMTVTCYKSECDRVPLPGPSGHGRRRVDFVDCDPDKGGGKDGCGHQKRVVWFEWILGGKGDCHDGKCRTAPKKRLLKKEVEVEIKGAYEYKWEIVDLCKGCEAKSWDKAPQPGPGFEVPPPPPVAGRVIYGRPVVADVSDWN